MQHLHWKIHTSVQIVSKSLTGFYALRQHKTTEHGLQMKSAEFDVRNLFEVDNADLKEELQACQHFLVDSELEKGRHSVFSFAMSTFDNSLINKKLDLVFSGLKCAAKVNLAFGFVLKNVEDGSCRFFYAHKNNTLMERSKLVCHQTNIPTSKRNYKKWILLIFVHEREPIPNGSFTNWQIWQFL